MNTRIDTLIIQLQRANSAVDSYRIIGDLLAEGLRPVEIARKAGIGDYTIRHHARLHRKLGDAVKELFLANKITFSLARALAGLPLVQQEAEARKALSQQMSVQTFRNKLRQLDDVKLMREMERLSDQLSALSGLDIQIRPDKHDTRAGSWIIRYADLGMFDVIVEKVAGKSSLENY
jgi:hypothetical protein